MQNKSGFTGRLDVKAFTLIELLVVVLIIGILAAVALPQYTLAVNKTRFAGLRSMAAPFIQAANAYHLANGTWPATFDELALDMPAGFEIITTAVGGHDYDCGQNNDMFCCMVPSRGNKDAYIMCSRKDESFTYGWTFTNSKHYCIANTNDTNARQLCKAVTRSNGQDVWGIYTPSGSKTGNSRFYELVP